MGTKPSDVAVMAADKALNESIFQNLRSGRSCLARCVKTILNHLSLRSCTVNLFPTTAHNYDVGNACLGF